MKDWLDEIIEVKEQKNERMTIYNCDNYGDYVNECCFGNFIDWCRSYSLMRNNNKVFEIDKKFETMEEFEEFEKENKLIKLPIYAYIHSGISFSTSRTGQYADTWDSGFFGFIYATYEEIRKEFGIKNVTKKVIEDVLKGFEKVIEMCTMAETEGFYRFQLETIKVCDKCGVEHLNSEESCGGFLGFDHKKSGLYDCVGENSKFQNWGEIKAKESKFD